MFNNITQKIKLLFCKDRELYIIIYNILGYHPCRLELYEEALIHRSAGIKNKSGRQINNERLEYLGDAILDAAVAEIVYNYFPNKREGFLTNTRAKLVQRDHLNKIGLNLGLDKLVKSATYTVSHNSYLFGNALEALIGALYLDHGYKAVIKFVSDKIIDKCLDDIASEELNYKSRLIEWTQKYKVSIEFNIIGTHSDQHNSPIFRSAVIVSGQFVGEGEGYTKKESHQAAAKEAYIRIHNDNSLRNKLLAE